MTDPVPAVLGGRYLLGRRPAVGERPSSTGPGTPGSSATSLGAHRVRRPVAEIMRIGAEVADVLAHVHARGVAHRDVKPGNILLAADGRVKLTDFGIARFTEDDSHPTVTGTIIGTPAYLAPEQVRGQPATGAAAVYALGLVLMELLRGSPVYQGIPEVAALARLTTPRTRPEVVDSQAAGDKAGGGQGSSGRGKGQAGSGQGSGTGGKGRD